MFIQYPHSVTVTQAEPVQDGIGNFSVSTGTVLTSICRAEPNTGNQIVNGVNGDSVIFQFAVYMPKQTVSISFGAIVVITLQNGAVFNGLVKGVDNISRLNTRIWV